MSWGYRLTKPFKTIEQILSPVRFANILIDGATVPLFLYHALSFIVTCLKLDVAVERRGELLRALLL